MLCCGGMVSVIFETENVANEPVNLAKEACRKNSGKCPLVSVAAHDKALQEKEKLKKEQFGSQEEFRGNTESPG